MYRHFAAIAESVDLPLVLYNIPARTGRNVEPETIERLAAIGPIVAVKEAAGSLDQVSELIVRTDLTILSGDDSLTLPMLAVGAEGVVSVIANLVPRDVMALVEAFQSGRIRARPRAARPAVSPLPRPPGPGPQPDSRQDGPGTPGPGQRRAAVAPLPPGRPVNATVDARASSRYGLLTEHP